MAAAGDIAVEGRIDPDFHRRRSETGSGGGDFALYGAERFGGAERMNGEAAVTHHHVENLLVRGEGISSLVLYNGCHQAPAIRPFRSGLLSYFLA